MKSAPTISNEENVDRILHQDWVVDGIIQLGAFTRLGATNVKKGVTLPAEALPLGLSADDILMEVGWSLIAISSLEEKLFKDNK